MVTRGLHAAGLVLLGEGDRLIEPADDNPEGFWENKRIVACNDELLEAAGGSWDNPPELLPQAVDDQRFEAVGERAIEALAGLRQYGHWGFKDPRTCLTAGYWLDLEPELRFVLCVRHPLEVALSLRRRNQNSYSLGLALWERYYTAALATMPADRRLVTHYDTWFLDPDGELDRLCAFAGLDGAGLAVRRDLRHHTIGVSLTDAGVSDRVIELYQELCAEAGNPLPPPPAADEGRVRRLILDGTVAARHADQRQEAVERLEAREAVLRAEMDELRHESRRAESQLRGRLRSLEAELGTTRRVALTPTSLRGELAPLVDSAALTRDQLAQLNQAVHHTAGRVEVAVANTQASPLARLWRRATQLFYRGGRRYVFRPSRVAAQRGRRAALPQAKSAARRLPPNAQTALRRSRRLVHRTRRRLTGAAAPAAPTHQDAPVDDTWIPQFLELTAATVGDRPHLVVDVDGLVPGEHVTFPNHATDGLGAIAELEARRVGGELLIAVTEGSRPWLHDRPELGDHLLGRYRVVADQPGAGLVVDLTTRHDDAAVTLRGEISRLAGGTDASPAVLDWTELDVAADLAELTVFTPPDGDHLPYLDDSVDIVVADRLRDRKEAARVASVAVITVEGDERGHAEVHTIESQREVTGVATPTVALIGDSTGDESWRRSLAETAAEAGADLRFEALTAEGLAARPTTDVVILVEAGLVPLPGAITAAAATVTTSPHRAVTGKVITSDARLESAGATVFADRSVALIGAGSAALVAPWHDFRRATCWAPGLVAAHTSLWHETELPAYVGGRDLMREWCAQVWADGNGVTYHPDVATVRVQGEGGETSAPLSQTAWQRVLDLRPDRPGHLDDGAWRYVLAHDDVENCRG